MLLDEKSICICFIDEFDPITDLACVARKRIALEELFNLISLVLLLDQKVVCVC